MSVSIGLEQSLSDFYSHLCLKTQKEPYEQNSYGSFYINIYQLFTTKLFSNLRHPLFNTFSS